MKPIMKIDGLIEGVVIKRPSLFIKSPYVSDIQIIENNTTNNNETLLTHSPSLGCCGLADKDAHVLIGKMPEKKQKKIAVNTEKEKLSCKYVIYLSIYKEKDTEQIIGIHPKLAEKLVENALKQNLLTKLSNVKKYKKEATMYVENKVDSRFDFMGIDENDIPFIMEVKNVPLADYEDVSIKERKKMSFDERPIQSKVAYFPDGYRKKQNDTISPRALKHIKELTIIKSESKTRCIMCYVIQRTDVNRFQPSVIDPEYRDAFYEAVNAGVEVITLVIQWNRNGEAYFIMDDLPIVFS
jgi:DNA-binding sugar fermentation-stimulating protein